MEERDESLELYILFEAVDGGFCVGGKSRYEWASANPGVFDSFDLFNALVAEGRLAVRESPDGYVWGDITAAGNQRRSELQRAGVQPAEFRETEPD